VRASIAPVDRDRLNFNEIEAPIFMTRVARAMKIQTRCTTLKAQDFFCSFFGLSSR
jgi:hypothetical protein